MKEEKQAEIKEEVKLEKKSNKKNNKNIIIIIILGMILLICGGYFLCSDLGGNDKKDNKEEQKEEPKKENDDGGSTIVEKKDLTKEQIIDNYNNKSNNYKEISISDETIVKLFNIYHQVSVVSKEQIALQQLSKDDVFEVSCDFIDVEQVKSAVIHGGEYNWCGSFSDEIEEAWSKKDADRVIELIKKNKTEAIKTEVLQNKVNELFGETSIRKDITLQLEEYKGNWYELPGNFIFFEEVNGKDYYARTSAAGGDPGDYNKYELKAAYDEGFLYLVYDITYIDTSTHVMVLDKDSKGNYVFVKDM